MPEVWDLENMGKEMERRTMNWTEDMSHTAEDWLNDEVRAFSRNNTELAKEIEDKTEGIVQGVGSWVKGEVEKMRINELALAQAQSAEDSNSVATGIVAGIAGACAGVALYAVVNRKSESASVHQPLL